MKMLPRNAKSVIKNSQIIQKSQMPNIILRWIETEIIIQMSKSRCKTCKSMKNRIKTREKFKTRKVQSLLYLAKWLKPDSFHDFQKIIMKREKSLNMCLKNCGEFKNFSGQILQHLSERLKTIFLLGMSQIRCTTRKNTKNHLKISRVIKKLQWTKFTLLG